MMVRVSLRVESEGVQYLREVVVAAPPRVNEWVEVGVEPFLVERVVHFPNEGFLSVTLVPSSTSAILDMAAHLLAAHFLATP
jgi:hypothetical protein